MAVIQLFLLDEFVNQNRIWSLLEYMSNKTGYPWSLDFFHFVNRQQRCNARFDLHVWSNVLKNIGDSKNFFLSKLNF